MISPVTKFIDFTRSSESVFGEGELARLSSVYCHFLIFTVDLIIEIMVPIDSALKELSNGGLIVDFDNLGISCEKLDLGPILKLSAAY